MQSVTLAQRQQLRAIPVQIQANAILNMSLIELHQFLETEAEENPAMSLDEGVRCPVCGFTSGDRACPVCGAKMCADAETALTTSSERDYLDRAFKVAIPEEAFDPFRTVASSTDFREHLKRQIRLVLSGRQLRIAEYLIDSLDDDGFFRESLFETAEEFAASVPEIESVLAEVQSLDPPGMGARDLRESLLIQLRALGENGPVAAYAERVLLDHWEDFAKLRIKGIAAKLGVSPSAVEEVSEFIRERLTPYPVSAFRDPFEELSPREDAVVAPDVIVHERDGMFVPEVVDSRGSFIKIDETYGEIYGGMRGGDSYLSEEDCRHVKEHVERVKCILEAIELRKKTLGRVASFVVEYQKEFLRHGPSHLRPLKQKDVASKLKVHESTICRALASKYCRLPSGETISFEVFFDAALPVRHLIRQIVARSPEPLSDGEIAKRLAEQGVTIARRTVAKYRDQLRLLPYQLRTV